jgi:hypothetical protein
MPTPNHKVSGARITRGRRTSQAFGGMNHSSYFKNVEEDAVTRSLRNRDALRNKMKSVLAKRMKGKGFFGKAGALPIKEFIRKLDKEGLSFVYQGECESL